MIVLEISDKSLQGCLCLIGETTAGPGINMRVGKKWIAHTPAVGLKTSYLFFMVSVSRLVTYLQARHFEKEILPSVLKIGTQLCTKGPLACTFKPALMFKMTGASHKITDTVAEGRTCASGDNRLQRLKWWTA